MVQLRKSMFSCEVFIKLLQKLESRVDKVLTILVIMTNDGKAQLNAKMGIKSYLSHSLQRF
jgi:hypothetical protein